MSKNEAMIEVYKKKIEGIANLKNEVKTLTDEKQDLED